MPENEDPQPSGEARGGPAAVCGCGPGRARRLAEEEPWKINARKFDGFVFDWSIV